MSLGQIHDPRGVGTNWSEQSYIRLTGIEKPGQTPNKVKEKRKTPVFGLVIKLRNTSRHENYQ